MTTFALVHGGWHGAWCWERVVPLLEERGHVAVAVDLPCDDPAAGLDTYAELVCQSLAGADDDVIVVGRSLGGLTIPLVAARRPVRHLIYLCALVPDVGRGIAVVRGARRRRAERAGFTPQNNVDRPESHAKTAVRRLR